MLARHNGTSIQAFDAVLTKFSSDDVVVTPSDASNGRELGVRVCGCSRTLAGVRACTPMSQSPIVTPR